MATNNKPFIVQDDFIVDNASGRQLVIPHGTAFARPENPIKGTIRYTDDAQVIEIYNGVEWQSAASAGDAVNASGAEEIALVQSIIFG